MATPDLERLYYVPDEYLFKRVCAHCEGSERITEQNGTKHGRERKCPHCVDGLVVG